MYDSASLMYSLQLLGVFVVLVFAVYPLLVMSVNRLLNGFWPTYWRTWLVVFIAGVAAFIVVGTLGYMLHKAGDKGTGAVWLLNIVAIIVTALVGGAVLNGFVRHKDNAPVGYGRAALICLVLGVVVVLINLGLGPWHRELQAKIKANMPTPVTAASTAHASSAPANASTTPVSTSRSAAPAATVPAHAATTARPAGAASSR